MENGTTPQFSVSDFLAVVNQSLEVAFGTVIIEGEVSSFKVNHQKYVFFDLKDEEGSVPCFMTVWQLRTPIEDGMTVMVRAQPKVTPWGKFSLTVTQITPKGEGSLKKSLDLLRAKLDKEGLFDDDRKRSLPSMPSLVGVISSTGAAGYADFIKIADDRFGGVRFLMANVQVQGAVAADQIIRAIEYFNGLAELPEVLVVVRGGGSADDLAVFNDEPLVRAIASSRIPVLTGIGHEIDESLSDLAADVSASTPSNAAQILLPDKHVIIERNMSRRMQITEQIAKAIVSASDRLALLRKNAVGAWLEQLQQALNSVGKQKVLIKEYDPEAVLRRGYAIISGKQKVGELLKVTTSSAIMKVRVEKYDKR